jgi:ferritin-like metal-binding protein YciE
MPYFKDTSVRKKIFLEYLNTIYSSKEHLLNFLPEVTRYASNDTLRLAIQENNNDNIKQMADIKQVFVTLKETYSEKKILAIKLITFDTYKTSIESSTSAFERDCAILFCLEVIDSIEVLYLRTLKNMAKGLHLETLHLQFPYDIAVDNQKLFDTIHQEMVA